MHVMQSDDFTLVETAERLIQRSAIDEYVGKMLLNGDVERVVEMATAEGLTLNQDYRFDAFGKGYALVKFGRK